MWPRILNILWLAIVVLLFGLDASARSHRDPGGCGTNYTWNPDAGTCIYTPRRPQTEAAQIKNILVIVFGREINLYPDLRDRLGDESQPPFKTALALANQFGGGRAGAEGLRKHLSDARNKQAFEQQTGLSAFIAEQRAMRERKDTDAKIADLNKQAQEKRQEADNTQNQISKLAEEKRTVDAHKVSLETELAQTEKKYQEASREYDDFVKANGFEWDRFGRLEPQRFDETAKNKKIDDIGGPIWRLKDALKVTADGLDTLVKNAENVVKKEDLDRVFREIGIDPQQVAREVRQVADSMRPMTLDEIDSMVKSLAARNEQAYREFVNIQAKVGKERGELDRLNAEIKQAENEKAMHDQNRKDHDRLADKFDAECRQAWHTCSWNIPKAAWERSMAAKDDAHMKLVDSHISWLKFNRDAPWGPFWKVALADMAVKPYQAVMDLLQDQMRALDTARKTLKEQLDKERERLVAEKDRLDAVAYHLQQDYLYRIRPAIWAADHKSADLEVSIKEKELKLVKLREEIAATEEQVVKLAGTAQPSQRRVQSTPRQAEFASLAASIERELGQAKKRADLRPEQQSDPWAAKLAAYKPQADRPPDSAGMKQTLSLNEIDKLERTIQQEQASKNTLQANLRRQDQQDMQRRAMPLQAELERRRAELLEAEKKAKQAEAAMKQALADAARTPKGQLQPDKVYPGDLVTFSGEGFALDTVLTLLMEGQRLDAESQTRIGADGRVAKLTFRVPVGTPSGTHVVSVVQGAAAPRMGLPDPRASDMKLALTVLEPKKPIEPEPKKDVVDQKFCNPDLPRLWQPGCVDKPVTDRPKTEVAEPVKPRTDVVQPVKPKSEQTVKVCDPNLPRLWQPGCVEPASGKPQQQIVEPSRPPQAQPEPRISGPTPEPTPAHGLRCDPGRPRYAQPGCIDAPVASSPPAGQTKPAVFETKPLTQPPPGRRIDDRLTVPAATAPTKPAATVPTAAPATSAPRCNPDIPRYSQPGCIP